MEDFFASSYECLTDEQAAAYLSRLGLPRPEKPDKDALDGLLRAQLLSIPFENLTVCDFRRPVELTPKKLFQKIITGGRGGYCFELNALFLALLRNLGFDAWPSACRVTQAAGFPKAVTHRATVVRIDEQLYFCDVGFGGAMSPQAIPIAENSPVTVAGEAFSFRKANDYWWHLVVQTPYVTFGGMEKPFVQLTAGIYNSVPLDFEPVNTWCSTSPESVFVNRRLVHRHTALGYQSLHDNVFTVMSAGKTEKLELNSNEEIFLVLTGTFGLNLSREEWFSAIEKKG